jgi:hypothetical protein
MVALRLNCRRLLVVGLALLLAAAADPLWDDIATIESAANNNNASEASSASAAVIRVPLTRRDPREVVNAVLSRPATTIPTTVTPALRGSEPGEGDIVSGSGTEAGLGVEADSQPFHPPTTTRTRNRSDSPPTPQPPNPPDHHGRLQRAVLWAHLRGFAGPDLRCALA